MVSSGEASFLRVSTLMLALDFWHALLLALWPFWHALLLALALWPCFWPAGFPLDFRIFIRAVMRCVGPSCFAMKAANFVRREEKGESGEVSRREFLF